MGSVDFLHAGRRISLDIAVSVADDSPMTTPRRLLVDSQNACDYHLVRQAWLLGWNRATRRDCSHRRGWLTERLMLLVRCFAVELYAYSIMSNHFHLVVRYDPSACERWTDEDVAARWVDAFPPTERGKPVPERKAEARELLLGDPERLARARRTLGSLSAFMKHLKQPVARRANVEDDRKGHFFEQRFYSGALLSEEALIAAMAYVDLNPVRAGIAERIEECRDTSIADRLQDNSEGALAAYLEPVTSGLPQGAASMLRPAVAARDYVDMVTTMASAIRARADGESVREAGWLAKISALRRPQRAYGPKDLLEQWAARRQFQLREVPLPV